MGISRREFLQIGGVTAAGAVVFAGCSPPAHELLVESAAQIPEDMVTGIDNWYATTCQMCPGGCGVIVRIMEGRAKKIEGNPGYPVNQGKLCARGQTGLQALYHPDRIQGPLRRTGDRGSGQFQSVSWNDAMNELNGKLGALHTGQAPGELLLVTPPLRGHLALVLQRFAQAPGSGFQVATFEPLEEARTSQMGAAQVLGIGPAPVASPLFDVANARFVLSFGADFLNGWLSPVQYGVAYGQFRGRAQARGVLVQVEPRVTSTGASADQWIPIKPGTEGVLALGIAQVIVSQGMVMPAAAQAAGLTASLLQNYGTQSVSQTTGLPEDQITALARRFGSQGPSLAIAGGPAVAQSNGPFNLAAILALNRLVGNVGQTGGVLPNPPSPLPDVPASAASWPSSWWQGLVQAINSGQPWPPNSTTPSVSPPKILMVREANPVHSVPSSYGFKEALAKVPYIVSFSSFMDETTAMADLVLPGHTYLEDWGSDIPEPGPGFQVMGFQQPVVNPIYDTRSFGDVILSIARQVGVDSTNLPWQTFKDVLQAGAQGLMGLKRGSVQATGFDEYWIKLLQQGGWWDETAKGTLPAIAPGVSIQPSEPNFAGSEQDYPFNLVPFPSASLGTGSGANLPWLQATPDPITTAVWETWVEINTAKGQEMGLQEGDVVKIESSQGSLEAPVYLHQGIRPDVIAIPMGQGHTFYGRWAQDRGVNVMDLLSPTVLRPDGTLAWAAMRVRISKTGQSVEFSKSEGQVLAVQPPDVEVVGVVRQ